MPSPYSIPPHAYPPPILSTHPMHSLLLLYPTPCMPSPYFIPAHAWPPPIHPTSCKPSPYSIPAHACPLPILSQPMHALSLFYPTLCMPSPYSLSPHKPPQYSILFQPMYVLLTLCHIPLKACFCINIWVGLFWICPLWLYHHHLPCLVIWSINLWHQVLNVDCFHSHELTTCATH